ncbi:sarcosine oxidase subunit gamma [Rhodoligotrophos defluvii]|uniref:sarcosine oxidase subunit gamma n=1 Tax=Rhodoligotrophos defluvii TaxID=2561934 RepID=UPI0014854A09|nr:sarcosine oxidase subunit gamma family protein [Rhodoligotrophos defluvii]
MSDPVFTSPLQDRISPGDLAIGLSEIADLGMIDLRGHADDAAFMAAVRDGLGVDLPLAPRSSARHGDLTILWLSIDQWLVLAPRAEIPSLAEALRARLAGVHSLVCDVSDMRCIIRLTGPNARTVLMKGCSLDLLGPEIKAGYVKRVLFAEIAALIHVVDTDPDVIDLFVFRSYADYAWEWLLKTGHRNAALTLYGEQPAPPV